MYIEALIGKLDEKLRKLDRGQLTAAEDKVREGDRMWTHHFYTHFPGNQHYNPETYPETDLEKDLMRLVRETNFNLADFFHIRNLFRISLHKAVEEIEYYQKRGEEKSERLAYEVKLLGLKSATYRRVMHRMIYPLYLKMVELRHSRTELIE